MCTLQWQGLVHQRMFKMKNHLFVWGDSTEAISKLDVSFLFDNNCLFSSRFPKIMHAPYAHCSDKVWFMKGWIKMKNHHFCLGRFHWGNFQTWCLFLVWQQLPFLIILFKSNCAEAWCKNGIDFRLCFHECMESWTIIRNPKQPSSWGKSWNSRSLQPPSHCAKFNFSLMLHTTC